MTKFICFESGSLNVNFVPTMKGRCFSSEFNCPVCLRSNCAADISWANVSLAPMISTDKICDCTSRYCHWGKFSHWGCVHIYTLMNPSLVYWIDLSQIDRYEHGCSVDDVTVIPSTGFQCLPWSHSSYELIQDECITRALIQLLCQFNDIS